MQYESSIMQTCSNPDCKVCRYIGGIDDSKETMLEVIAVLDMHLAEKERLMHSLLNTIIKLKKSD